MATRNFLIKTVFVWIGLTVIAYLASLAVPSPLGVLPREFDWTHMFWWGLVSNFIAAGTLVYVAIRSSWLGLRLALALSALNYGTQAVNCVEAVFFLHMKWTVFLPSLIAAVIMIPVWMFVFRTSNFGNLVLNAQPARSWGWWLPRGLGCVFGYLVVYYAAGLMVFPHVRHFYSQESMPSLGIIVSLQLFVRGPIFLFLGVLLTRMLHLSRRAQSIAVGVVFTILSGVVPLIIPSPFMPDEVRWAHFVEVGISNFIFGTTVGFVFFRRVTAPKQEALSHG